MAVPTYPKVSEPQIGDVSGAIPAASVSPWRRLLTLGRWAGSPSPRRSESLVLWPLLGALYFCLDKACILRAQYSEARK